MEGEVQRLLNPDYPGSCLVIFLVLRALLLVCKMQTVIVLTGL